MSQDLGSEPRRTAPPGPPSVVPPARAQVAHALASLAAALRGGGADLTSAALELPPEPADVVTAGLVDRLAWHAETLGLRIVRMDAPVAALLALPEHRLPVAIESASGEIVVLIRRDGDRRLVDLAGREQWLGVAELAGRLGTPDVTLPAGAAELATPLTGGAGQVRTPAEGDHGHAWRARVGRLIALERGDLGTVAFYAVLIGLSSLATPLAVQMVVNTVAFTALVQPLVVLVLFLLLVLGGGAAVRALQALVVERLQERLFVRAATELAYRLPRVELGALEGTYGPEKVNRFFDVVSAQKALSTLLIEGLFLALQTCLGLLLLAFYHPVLLAFDVLLVVGVSAIVWGLGRHAVATSLGESQAKYALAGWLEDVARSPLAFRLHPDAALTRADELSRAYLTERRRHFAIVFRQIVGSLTLQVLASAALLAVGGALVLRGQLSLGQLVAAELVVTLVVTGLAKLGKHLEAYYDLATALEKLGSLTDLPLERTTGERRLTGSGPVGLSLLDVAFARVDGRMVFDGLNLEIRPGERLAIVGRPGAGKSTLAELMLGLRSPDRGVLRIDGIDLRELRLGDVRDHVALVRDVELVTGTIFDNVAFWRPGLSVEDVHRALAIVGLGDVLARLPDGVRTRVLPDGAPLSLGEAQRLVLARALAGRPRLLIVDGLLDGFEADVLRELERSLAQVGQETTLVVLTGLEAIAAWADRVHHLGGRR